MDKRWKQMSASIGPIPIEWWRDPEEFKKWREIRFVVVYKKTHVYFAQQVHVDELDEFYSWILDRMVYEMDKSLSELERFDGQGMGTTRS